MTARQRLDDVVEQGLESSRRTAEDLLELGQTLADAAQPRLEQAVAEQKQGGTDRQHRAALGVARPGEGAQRQAGLCLERANAAIGVADVGVGVAG